MEALDGMRMKKGAGRVEGDDMLLVVEKVVVGARTLPNCQEYLNGSIFEIR
jgi:hypothetical protein